MSEVDVAEHVQPVHVVIAMVYIVRGEIILKQRSRSERIAHSRSPSRVHVSAHTFFVDVPGATGLDTKDTLPAWASHRDLKGSNVQQNRTLTPVQ